MQVSRRITAVLALGAAGFILAGGYFHFRDWMDLYRHLPAEFPGSAVVRIGFPVNMALSVLSAGALVLGALVSRWLLPYATAGSIMFQAGSLAALIKSRTGSLFGWTELGWAASAGQTRAVEIAALAALTMLTAVLAARHPSGATAGPGRGGPALRPATVPCDAPQRGEHR